MKKFKKVFAIVLTVLIIVGTFAATASVSAAVVSGVTVESSENFEMISSNWGATASDGTNLKIGTTVFQQGDRCGVVSAGISYPYEDNKYAIITQDDLGTGTSSPYVYSAVGARPTTETLNNSADDISKYSYLVYDIDVMSPTGEFISGASISFSARCFNASGSLSIWNNSALNSLLFFGNDTDGSYIYINGYSSNKKYVDPYDFTHITCVIEPIVTSTSYNARTHVYFDDQYFGTKTGSAASADSFYNSTPHASIIEYRISYLLSENPAQTLALDNISYRSFSTDYNGNLSTVLSAKNDLSAWESNLYDADAAPVGYYEAANETKKATYLSLAEAIAEASDGDVILLACDSTEEISVNKSITVKANTSDGSYFEHNLTPADGYISYVGAGNEIVFESEGVNIFQYVSGGSTVTVGRDTDFSSVIASADDGSTVNLFQDTYVDISSSISVSKNLTFDLGGNTLYFGTAHKTYVMSVGSNKTLTFKNGTIVGQYNVAAGYPGKSYVLFSLSSGTNLNLENVNTYTGTLAWNFSSNNPTVTVNGGEHHTDMVATDAIGGFVESRSNTTFVANNATFYCGANGGGLFSSVHYRTPSNLTEKSTFTYNNCNIIGEGAKTNLIHYDSEFTNVYFNNCDILGSIKPGVHSWDVNKGIGAAKEGSIVIGEGCRISGESEFSFAVGAEYSYGFSEINENQDYSLKIAEGALASSDFSFSESAISAIYGYGIEKIESCTVSWYKEDGKTVIKTEEVAFEGIATPPSYVPSSTDSNGWYTASYDGWSKSFGGEMITDYKITEDTSFYPAVSSSLSSSLTGGYYNLSLFGSVTVNFYLPIAPDGITVNGVYVGEKEVFAKNVFVGGVAYSSYTVGEVGATELSAKIDITVSYSVNGNDFEANFTLSPYKYATVILLDSLKEESSYPESAHKLVADMIRYSTNLMKYLNYATGGTVEIDTTVEALYTSYSSLCTALPENFDDLSEYDVSGISGYVKSASFEVSKYQPAYRFEFVEGSGVVDCFITMNGYYSSAADGANYGSIKFESSDKSYYNGEYISAAYIRDIPMYNVDNTVTISVLLENGTIKSGTYNLNAYYNFFEEDDSASRAYLETFLKSLRAFSTSAVKYRYATFVVTEENAVNFLNCEHTEGESAFFEIPDNALPVSAEFTYCPDCDTYFISYAQFGAVGDGVSYGLDGAEGTNDFAAIRKTHTVANKIAAQYPQYNIAVLGEGTEGNSFYIGRPNDGDITAIIVKTDVNWNGAHFIIDDTSVTNKDGTSDYKQSIFCVSSDSDNRKSTVTSNMPLGVASGATNIGYAPGKALMIQLNNASVRNYIRYGANANTGGVQNEVIIVDAYGNVDPTTPVQWDYTNKDYCSYTVEEIGNANESGAKKIITMCNPVDSDGDGICDTCNKTITRAFSATAYDINDKPITISGLDKDGNINCTWETITNSDVDVSSYDQFARNIKIERANVTIQGIDRVFVEDDSSYTPRQTYAGFVQVYYAYNTVIKDMLAVHHLGHNIWIDGVDTGNGLGSYEFSGNHSINTSWINCKIKNFFKEGGVVSYRGMFGSNYLRNSYLKDCILTSFDSHSGAYNVTIEDSTFEHINFVGGGDAIMRNVTVYVDGGWAACILRSDYGSMWQGNLKIDGLNLLHAETFSRDYIDIVRAHYANHYFGYTSHNPTKIYANNVSIKQYNRTTAEYTAVGGTIVEENLTESTKKLGILNILNNELKYDYDYSTANENNLNPKVCTEAVYITNSDVEISYPDHWYFKDMKVYIDGAEQDWFTVREGLHTDANSDGVCDNGCGQPLG